MTTMLTGLLVLAAACALVCAAQWLVLARKDRRE